MRRIRILACALCCLVFAAPVTSHAEGSLERLERGTRPDGPLGVMRAELARGATPADAWLRSLKALPGAGRPADRSGSGVTEAEAPVTPLGITAVGDLDGDGGSDIVGHFSAGGRYSEEAVAVRGSDGAEMWRTSDGGYYHIAFVAVDLDDAGTPGVAVIGYGIKFGPTGWAPYVEITVRDGAGGVVWKQRLTTVADEWVSGLYVYGVLDATADPGMEFLLAEVTGDQLAGTVDAVTPKIVGASGISAGEPLVEVFDYGLLAAGDLTGDGYDDYIVHHFDPVDASVLVARDGRAHGQVWRALTDAYVGWVATMVPDGTGDGQADIVLSAPDYPRLDNDWYFYTDLGATFVSGADGSQRWYRPTAESFAANDVDGDGLSDITIASRDWVYEQGASWLVIRYEIVADHGVEIAARTYRIRDTYYYSLDHRVGTAGDVDSDGVVDWFHEIRVVDGDREVFVHDRGVVSGRTLAKIWEGRPARRGHARLDGSGADLLTISLNYNGGLHLKGQDGATGATLFAADHVVGEWFNSVATADFDGDGRDDVAIVTAGENSSPRLRVFSRGAPLWSL